TRERRALCRLGTAATVFRRSSGGLQVAAQIVHAERSKTGRRGPHAVLSFPRQTYVRATTTRSPPFLGDSRAVAGRCVDWHATLGDAYDQGETVPTLPRQRSRLARRGDRLAQFTATHSGGLARQSRPRRLLDVHVHQLASHTPVHSRLGHPVQ